jgi:peroxiredoxin
VLSGSHVLNKLGVLAVRSLLALRYIVSSASSFRKSSSVLSAPLYYGIYIFLRAVRRFCHFAFPLDPTSLTAIIAFCQCFHERDQVMHLSIRGLDERLLSDAHGEITQHKPRTYARSRPPYHAMTRPLAKLAAAMLLFGLIHMTVSAKEEGSKAAAIKEQIDWSAQKVTVLFFIVHDCPICNRYVPEINRIVRDYQGRGFGFTAVYSEADFSREDAQEHARDYRFDLPFVIDSDHRFAAQLGVKFVPEAVVLNSKRELLYRGRIDDLYADVDKQRPTAVHHDLREALDKIAAGIKPDHPSRPAVGCPINYDQPGS